MEFTELPPIIMEIYRDYQRALSEANRTDVCDSFKNGIVCGLELALRGAAFVHAKELTPHGFLDTYKQITNILFLK